jgi:RNA polymerase sigma factor (sigma-70 family)
MTDRKSKLRILDEQGQPLSPRVEDALISLVPKFQRHFPSFRDEASLVDVLEQAGRKIVRRENKSGPIDRLHAYAWVTLRSVATSRLRSGSGRLEQKMIASQEGAATIDSTPALMGSAEDIERRILLREVLDSLTVEERRVCIWKKAGFSSQEIADRRGGTAAAVDTLLSRIRQKVRKLGGPSIAGQRPDEIAKNPSDIGAEETPPARDGVRTRDGK